MTFFILDCHPSTLLLVLGMCWLNGSSDLVEVPINPCGGVVDQLIHSCYSKPVKPSNFLIAASKDGAIMTIFQEFL